MGWFSSVTGGIFDPISEPLADAEDTVREELSGLDDFVNENVPGGWAGVIMIAAGVYYAPEIGAYISADGAVIGSTQGLTAEQIAIANASADPIAAANELAAWTQTEAAAAAAAEAAAAEVITPETITNEIAGPELLGEAGGNTFPLEAPQEGLIPLGDAAGATAAEVTAAKTAMAEKGLTFKDALNYVRGGLLVNALVGDPLGLAGEQPTGNVGGSTGFAIVPVPAEWKSPTYAAPAAPIDINSLFTDMNLLGGTQWQGLPTQKPNLSFNDIFASGQQSTPMGTPVDINQIVSAILGQNTAIQKSA